MVRGMRTGGNRGFFFGDKAVGVFRSFAQMRYRLPPVYRCPSFPRRSPRPPARAAPDRRLSPRPKRLVHRNTISLRVRHSRCAGSATAVGSYHSSCVRAHRDVVRFLDQRSNLVEGRVEGY